MSDALFGFEQDGRYALRRIPMIVRFKLDTIGLRFDFAAWAVLTREERQELVDLPCRSESEKQHYRERLHAMLAPHADKAETRLQEEAVDPAPAWAQPVVPQQVHEALRTLNLDAVSDAQWQGLQALQRFALIKLTRPGHKNANLPAALREFGLAADVSDEA